MQTILGAGITERDMDLLFLEEFAASKTFANLFFSQIGVHDYEIEKIIHSQHLTGEGIIVAQAGAETSRGESDMTILYRHEGSLHALLIEDKINACAQPNQYQRYVNRGNNAIEHNEYTSFHIFLVAPELYLGSSLASDYPLTVSYEEILLYFQNQDTERSAFKASLLVKAIDKERFSYVIQVPSQKVMDFYDSYIEFVTNNYKVFHIETSKGAQHGSKSSWIVFSTKYPNIKIKHKTRSSVDLLIKTGQDESKRQEAISQLETILSDVSETSASLIEFSQDLCLRIDVPSLDRSRSVYEQIEPMEKCMSAIGQLYSIIGKWTYNICRRKLYE